MAAGAHLCKTPHRKEILTSTGINAAALYKRCQAARPMLQWT